MQKSFFPRSANLAVLSTSLLAVTFLLAGPWHVHAQSRTSAQAYHYAQTPGSAGPLMEHTAPQVLDGTATRVGHYNPEQKLRLVLAVMPPHMDEEEQFLKELTTKGSPNFHKFLTPEEWNTRFAPSAEDEQKVVDWAQSQGFTVTNRYNHRLIVDVEAPAGVIEKAFNVTINNYRVGDEVDFANDRDPVLPASLSSIVYNIQGLNNIQREHGSSRELMGVKGPDYAEGPVVAEGGAAHGGGNPLSAQSSMFEEEGPVSNITNGEMDPSDLFSSQTYNYNGLQRFSHCCNVHNDSGGSPNVSSIAIAGFGEFLESDINGFASAYGLWFTNNYYYIDGNSSFCPTGQSPPCATGETTEDIEWSNATSNNPATYLDVAHQYIYLGANFNNGTYTDMYSQMLKDNTARVMTTSWSCTEIYGCSTSTMDARNAIFSSMVGQGWTLIAASGDRGATDDCNSAHIAISFPASDPLVIAAGGTQLSLNSNGTWAAEKGWTGGQFSGACGENDGGSGGGVSSYYAQPGWQSAYPSVKALGSMRLTPDLSLNALGIGQNLYINGSMSGDGNGTSVVAPELAGFFAQENTYLDYIGNICGSGGTSACTPVGDPHPFIYENGNNQTHHNPFYDITTGCNSNDVTTAGGLSYYCAKTGYDLVTGWGTANMMQLAWGINWQLIPSYGEPAIAYTGPAVSTWYNSDQEISWKVTDVLSQGTGTPSGVAGFTQGWDSITPDSYSKAHGGVNTSDSFYYGPHYAFGTTGCLSFAGLNGCSSVASPQGCHTAIVEAWDNQGTTTTKSYGPICYDTVAPTIAPSTNPTTSGTVWVDKSVVVTLTATDPGGSAASGIKNTYYGINTGECYPGNVGGCTVYSGPFTISAPGQTYIYYFTEDKAGNYSFSGSEPYIWVSIDEAPPVTTASLSGTVYSGSIYETAVGVTLSATDTGGSGVAATYYTVDGGAQTTYSGSAFTVSSLGAHTVKYWSVDGAGNVESTHTLTFTVYSQTTATLTATPASSVYGQPVTMTATITATLSGTPTGTVQFWNGATSLGTSTLSGGVATLTTSALPVGALTLQASYLGAGNFIASNSAPFDESVTLGSTATTVKSSLNPSILNNAVTFTATVSPAAPASGTPVGTVTFLSNGTSIGAATLSGGVAALTTTALTLGTDSITAVYSGNADYSSSTSAGLSQVVNGTSATLTTPAPSSTLSGSNVAFAWSGGVGVTEYELWVGSTGVGSSNLNYPGVTTGTTETVSGLPTAGGTLYVRLYSKINGAWQFHDYTYTAATLAGPAVLTSPVLASTLTGSSVAFSWSTGSGATEYELWVGSTGVGSSNLNYPGVTTGTTETVSGLPTNGETLYVRLYSKISGVWQYNDYTYTAERVPAVLTTPTPSSTLTSTSVAFTWGAAAGATDYELWVGTTGVGSSNLNYPGVTTGLTETVSGLPASGGGTVYVRLYSKISGVWVYNDYTYTAE